VLNDVSLGVAEGEFFGLLGRNGAGKTTLFRVISTLVLPDSGAVHVFGIDAVLQAHEIRGMVAPVIASERSLYWRLDARENLRVFATLQGVHRRDVEREIDRVLGIVSLVDTGIKLVGAFSSGMRQRLLIARALLGRPRILLLDEPTKGLDPVSARDFRRFLRETIAGEQGCTVLLATHDAEDVWNLCDTVAILDEGTLLAVDATVALRMRAGDEVYRVWVREDGVQTMLSYARQAGLRVLGKRETIEPGWCEVTVELTGGSQRSAEFLARLAREGVVVARLERASPDLAELIERVVASGVAAKAGGPAL
jgi:ABC-2 type transport system ATP-binding protein